MKSIKWLLIAAVAFVGKAGVTSGQEAEKSEMGDMFVHPFLPHMALPDPLAK